VGWPTPPEAGKRIQIMCKAEPRYNVALAAATPAVVRAAMRNATRGVS
jgi:hypothetical protein